MGGGEGGGAFLSQEVVLVPSGVFGNSAVLRGTTLPVTYRNGELDGLVWEERSWPQKSLQSLRGQFLRVVQLQVGSSLRSSQAPQSLSFQFHAMLLRDKITDFVACVFRRGTVYFPAFKSTY